MARMQDKRLWLAGSVVAALVIALIGWFAVISPQLSAASSLQSETQSAQDANLLLLAKVTRLQRESGKLPTLTADLARLLAALPPDSGLPAFTRQVSTQAAQHQIQLTSIVVGAITPVAGNGSATTSKTTSPSGSVLAIPVTLLSTGSAANQLAFLKAIQVDGPRRALVTSSQLSPAADKQKASVDASCTMATQLSVFTAPLSAAQQAQLRKLLNGDLSN